MAPLARAAVVAASFAFGVVASRRGRTRRGSSALEPDRPDPRTQAALNRVDEEELEAAAERRRANADSFAWGVPGLAVAAEAFLLTVALSADTRPLGRLLAALAGTFVVVGALHFLSKQAVYFALYDTVIERQRRILGRMSLHREYLDRLDLPDHVSRPHRSWFSWNLRSVLVWKSIFVGLILIDLFIVGYSIFELVDDPGWLSRQ